MHNQRIRIAYAVALVGVLCLSMLACDSDSLNSSVVSWSVDDDCNDQQDIMLRFFDETNGDVWPSDSECTDNGQQPGCVYVVADDEPFHLLIDCLRDHVICYGATTDPPSDMSWGVGLDGDEVCNNCCAICGDGASPEESLKCP